MQNRSRPPDPEFTDSDRARLRELSRQREIDEAIADRRKKRAESVKAWAQWIAAVSVAGGVVWDGLLKLATFIREHIR